MGETTAAHKKLTFYIDLIIVKLRPEQWGVLDVEIPHPGRMILAVRSYLRAAEKPGSLENQWTWPKERIEEYERSEDYRKATAEVHKVKVEFARRNPGYALEGDVKVRSLSEQVLLWNKNESVLKLGEELRKKALREIMRPRYPEYPDEENLSAFKHYLMTVALSGEPTNAAPGLSRHGQGRACDFTIKKDKKKIASTGAAQKNWDFPGWTTKLKQAVTAATKKLEGPLRYPKIYEPWHYVYKP